MAVFRPLTRGPIPPPMRVVVASPANDPMRQHFKLRPQPNAAGALEFSYETLGLEPVSLVGAGTGFNRYPIGVGQPPSIALNTVAHVGLPPEAGQLFTTPLSPPVE